MRGAPREGARSAANICRKQVPTCTRWGRRICSAPMEIRDKILSAAARVYSQHGFRGATTRLIAQEADVNEVTLFRTFGSKEALIEEAIRFHSESAEFARLPEEPDDPERELGEWCEAHIAHIRRRRPLIVSCMADIDERPEVACGAARGADRAWGELHRYLGR